MFFKHATWKDFRFFRRNGFYITRKRSLKEVPEPKADVRFDPTVHMSIELNVPCHLIRHVDRSYEPFQVIFAFIVAHRRRSRSRDPSRPFPFRRSLARRNGVSRRFRCVHPQISALLLPFLRFRVLVIQDWCHSSRVSPLLILGSLISPPHSSGESTDYLQIWTFFGFILLDQSSSLFLFFVLLSSFSSTSTSWLWPIST